MSVRVAAAVLVAAVLAIAASACAPTASTPAPASATPVTEPSGADTLSPAPGSIVACPPSDDALSAVFDPPYPSPVLIPAVLPADLPTDPVPHAANIYAIGVPADPSTRTPAWRYWLVGPAASPCTVAIGSYRQVDVAQDGGGEVTAFFPGVPKEALALVCGYVATARTALTAAGGDPADCQVGGSNGAGEVVLPIDPGVPGASIMGVIEPADPSRPDTRTAIVYAFAFSADGKSWQASDIECTMPRATQAICPSAFSFFVAQLDTSAAWGLGPVRRAALLKPFIDALRQATGA